jgi:hypothetical protein
MTQIQPHIYFHSDMDSTDEWREALASQFDDFKFSVGDDVDSPESVDVAMIWTLPDCRTRIHFGIIQTF